MQFICQSIRGLHTSAFLDTKLQPYEPARGVGVLKNHRVTEQMGPGKKNQEAIMDKINALIAVLSTTSEFVKASPSPPTPNLARPFTELVDSTLFHLLWASTVPTPLNTRTEIPTDDEMFCPRQKVSSAKNFAVFLVQKCYELDVQNVCGISKNAQDIEKVQTIQELVINIILHHLPNRNAYGMTAWLL